MAQLERDRRFAAGGALIRRLPGPTLALAALFWAAASLIGRAAPMSGPSLAFWRSVLGALAYLVLTRGGRRIRMADLRTASLGGVGFGLSIVGYYIAYKTTTLVSAGVIAGLQPLALGLIDERSGRRLSRVLWSATAAAVAGTVLVVVGSSGHSGTWSLRGDLFAAAATVANSVYVVGTKRARKVMGPAEYQSSMLCVAALITLPFAIWSASGHFVPTPAGWAWVTLLAAVGGVGHLLFSAAQHHVSVTASSSIVLVEVVAIAIGALIVFGQSIGALQVAGMVVVTGAVAVWIDRSTAAEPSEAAEPRT